MASRAGTDSATGGLFALQIACVAIPVDMDRHGPPDVPHLAGPAKQAAFRTAERYCDPVSTRIHLSVGHGVSRTLSPILPTHRRESRSSSRWSRPSLHGAAQGAARRAVAQGTLLEEVAPADRADPLPSASGPTGATPSARAASLDTSWPMGRSWRPCRAVTIPRGASARNAGPRSVTAAPGTSASSSSGHQR